MSDDRLQNLLTFLNQSPDDSFLSFAVAKEYEKRDQFDQALKYYLNIKVKDPEYIGLYYHLGKLYETIQEEILALQTYNEGIELGKKQRDFHATSELNNAKTNLEIILGN